MRSDKWKPGGYVTKVRPGKDPRKEVCRIRERLARRFPPGTVLKKTLQGMRLQKPLESLLSRSKPGEAPRPCGCSKRQQGMDKAGYRPVQWIKVWWRSFRG